MCGRPRLISAVELKCKPFSSSYPSLGSGHPYHSLPVYFLCLRKITYLKFNFSFSFLLLFQLFFLFVTSNKILVDTFYLIIIFVSNINLISVISTKSDCFILFICPKISKLSPWNSNINLLLLSGKFVEYLFYLSQITIFIV